MKKLASVKHAKYFLLKLMHITIFAVGV